MKEKILINANVNIYLWRMCKEQKINFSKTIKKALLEELIKKTSITEIINNGGKNAVKDIIDNIENFSGFDNK